MAAILNLTTGIVFLTSWSGTVSGGSLTLTGVLKLADGTAAAPSLAFASAPTIGWFNNGSGIWGLSNGSGSATVNLDGAGGDINASASIRAKSNTAFISLGGSSDVILRWDAANTLAQRNGVNAQAFNVYNTYTDASNYESAGLSWSGNTLRIFTDKAGTGTSRSTSWIAASHNFSIGTLAANTPVWQITAGGNISDQGSHTITAGSTIQGSAIGAGVAPTGTISSVGNGSINWVGRTFMTSPADGIMQVSNNGVTGFTRLILGTNDATTNGISLAVNSSTLQVLTGDGSSAFRSLQFANGAMSGKFTTYNNITTDASGFGVPAVVGGPTQRKVAATSAQTIGSYTVGAADGTFEVSANILVTTATTHSFTVTCAYTDEGNTARTTTLNFSTVAGVISNAAITNVAGAVPYEGVPLHIRCKASTTITIATTGTFTTVTYNGEGYIVQKG